MNRTKTCKNLEKKHLDYLDFSKGLGIILVIIGHSLFPLHQIIDVFHMPLFFFIAGITLKNVDEEKIFLLKKINRIFIPYIFFSICSAIIENITGFNGAYFNPPLWFLQTIFVSLLISYYILKKGIKYRYAFLILFIIIGAWICKQDSTILPFNIERSIRATIFVLCGYEFSKFDICSLSIRNNIIFILVSIVLFGLLFYFSYNYYDMRGSFGTGEIQRYNYTLFYFTSFLGIFSTIFLSVLIKKIRIINWWGKHSLIILCVHFPITEQINIIISNCQLYQQNNIPFKIISGLIAYIIVLFFSSIFILLCKKYIPQFTGYRPFFT